MIAQAMVLTAGLGTRLRPLTDVRAKPAVPVGNEPLIRRIVSWLTRQGVNDLVLNLHHRPDTLTSVLGDGSDLAARVRYSWEQPLLLGSAGGVRQVLSMIGAETFFVVNGDTITDVDLPRLAGAHLASGALATLALVANREFERYGGVLVDEHHRVTGFVRRGPSARGSWHFVGVQLAHASVFATVAPGACARSIGGVYDDLIRDHPGSIHAFCTDADFWDIGTPADYWRTSERFPGGSGRRDGLQIGRGATIDATARIDRSILWDQVVIGAHAVLDHCIVTDGARVAAGAEYRHAIIVRKEDEPEAVVVFPLVS
jgi:NDP-sugar pyrophosphorylase family protein